MTAELDTPRSWFAPLLGATLTLVACQGDATAPDASVPDAAVLGDAQAAVDAVTPVDGASRSGAAGLQQLGTVMVPRGHTTELIVTPDAVFVATSFDGVKSFRVAADGTPTLAWEHSEADLRAMPSPVPRCTAIAWHAASSTIYCTAADAEGLSWYHVRAPDRLELAPGGASGYGHVGVRAMRVVGDALLLAGATQGLLRATIAADGTPGPRMPTAVQGDVVDVDGDAATLVVLERARGLVQARVEGDRVVEVGALALDGPLLDVAVRGQRAYVAMGSQGAAVVDLTATGPQLRRRWRPSAVLTGIDGDGDTVLASSTTGLWAFDVATETPRTTGFLPTAKGALDVRYENRRAYSADWIYLTTLALDPRGEVHDVDVSPGYFTAPGRGVTFQVRNPGDRALTVAVRGFTEPCMGNCVVELRSTPVAASGSVEVALTAAELTRLRDSSGRVRIQVAAREGDDHRMGSLNNFVLLTPSTGVAGPPPLGASFPRLMAAAGSGAPPSLPLPSQATRAVFITADCALQWAEVEDLAWSVRNGSAAGGATPVILFVPPNDMNPNPWWGAPFLGLLGAGSLANTSLYAYAGSVPRAPGAPLPGSDQIFTTGFGTQEIDGPDTNADYLVDAAGRVVNFERIYRGEHPLAARDSP